MTPASFVRNILSAAEKYSLSIHSPCATMHPTAAALLQDIQAGNYDVALILADWIDERGHWGTADRLRRRYARWQRQRVRLQEKDMRRDVDLFPSSGSRLFLSLELRISKAHEDALLVAYCTRLLASLPI